MDEKIICVWVSPEARIAGTIGNNLEWICPNCGKTISRDYNAALNILNEGLKIIGLSSPEFTLADYPTMDDRLSNEILKSSDRMKQETNVFH